MGGWGLGMAPTPSPTPPPTRARTPSPPGLPEVEEGAGLLAAGPAAEEEGLAAGEEGGVEVLLGEMGEGGGPAPRADEGAAELPEGALPGALQGGG